MKKIFVLLALAFLTYACTNQQTKDIKNYENLSQDRQVKSIIVKDAGDDLYVAKITYKYSNDSVTVPTYNLYFWNVTGYVMKYENCELKFTTIERLFPEALNEQDYVANKETWKKLQMSEIHGMDKLINSNPEIVKIKQQIENARRMQQALDEVFRTYVMVLEAKADSVLQVTRMQQLELQESIESLEHEADSIIKQIKSELHYNGIN